MTQIVSVTADLMFSSNIEATLARAGHIVRTAEDLTGLEAALEEDDAALVILDLHAGFDAADVVAIASGHALGPDAQRSPVPVVAFGRHTEPALLRHAREAGCVEAVPRSTFVEQMTGLVERHAA
jgi:DNA-binding NarL/FixJ family response regulator